MAEIKTRANSVLAVVIDEASESIVFNVQGAAPDGGSKSITFRLGDVHPANRTYAALHGFKQRIGDMAALSRNAKTGTSATPADKFEAIAEGITHYHSGTDQWNMRVASGERTDGELAMLIRAVCEIKPAAGPEKIREWLKSKSKAERTTLALRPDIKSLMDGYRAENAADVDADAMLDELT